MAILLNLVKYIYGILYIYIQGYIYTRLAEGCSPSPKWHVIYPGIIYQHWTCLCTGHFVSNISRFRIGCHSSALGVFDPAL